MSYPRAFFVIAGFVFLAISCESQSQKLSDWTSLIDAGKCTHARKLCEQFVSAPVLSEQVEAQKCLANVALCGNSVVLLEGDNAGGGNLRGGYTDAAVSESIAHLDQGIRLAPQDLTIHLGRLHVLEQAGRYTDMVKALEESIAVYKGPDALDAWMAYSPELMDLRQYQVGLEFMQVLDKHYPSNPSVVGNIGAFLDLLKRDDEAIPYLKRAVELAPSDAINAWDLARAYDYSNQTALADEWYKKALSLPMEPGQKKDTDCLYAQFVADKLRDLARACTLERSSCDKEQQKACNSLGPAAADRKSSAVDQ